MKHPVSFVGAGPGDPELITVKGKQTHGARPWDGVDPIVIAAQIVLGLQTIGSRQVDVTLARQRIRRAEEAGGERLSFTACSSSVIPALSRVLMSAPAFRRSASTPSSRTASSAHRYGWPSA